MSARARWAVVVLVLAVAGAVALWPRADDPPAAESTPSRPAQDLGLLRERAALPPCPSGTGGPAALRGVEVTCLGDGTPLDLAGALPGRALVNFWATWCVPCQEELKVLDAYSREPGAVPVVAVLVGSKEGDGLELLAKLGVRLPAVHDPADAVRAAVRARPGLPLSVVVGGDGALTEVADPPVFESVEQVREVVG
ncbi:TlpA family protein disulfide reductase [Saccharothrix syringae]|uniref:TlpA family protein disulfide reductase n=1 Tax=Saccharothrix syringae TaxID=103733 RepID=A0A5Q0GRI3_SACSY|nr:TlpA disulfide reductase family protein [Saccharothrix syringae]QFZ16295.1 TlpA family protein disulfide reductase [Saccharothrix syringae]